MVQPVFRIESWKRLPHIISGIVSFLMVHTDGAQRDIQQCMGNYLKRMERMFTEDDCGIDYWYIRINSILIPPAIS